MSTEQADTLELMPDGNPAHDQTYNSDFWNDLVLTYCTLVLDGFRVENTFVLYGDGEDFKSDWPIYRPPYCDATRRITDLPLVGPTRDFKDNICNVLCCMATGRPAVKHHGTCRCCAWRDRGIGGFSCRDHHIPQLRSDDFLFVWLKGHGEVSDCAVTLRPTSAGPVGLADSELEGLLERLPSRRRVLVLETCGSGGWLDNLDNQSTVALASSGNRSVDPSCGESSQVHYYAAPNPAAAAGAPTELAHARFTYWINAALRQHDLAGEPVVADADGNNLVSVREAYEVGNDQVSGRVVPRDSFPITQNPDVRDGGQRAPCVFTRLPQPGKDREIFGRDHVCDDGVVPSDTEPWTVGADLWIRNRDDGQEEPQDLLLDQSNFLKVRVRNLGCTDPGEIKVKLFWAKWPECGDPRTWHEIGQNGFAGLPVLTSRIATLTWDLTTTGPTVPVPERGGTYCLIASMATVADPPNTEGRAYWDPNKVTIVFTVGPAPPSF